MADEADLHAKSIALMKWLSQETSRLGVAGDTYVVGGAVRDFQLGHPIKDIDLTIDAVATGGKDAAWLAHQLSNELNAQGVPNTVAPDPSQPMGENRLRVAKVHINGPLIVDGVDLQGEVIDIATTRTETYTDSNKPDATEPATIEDDVARREFTFNTLLWRLADVADGPEKAEILDLGGCGLRDLKEGVLSCPSDPDKTFEDDPTRMLRAVKFMMRYGFSLTPDALAAIKRNAPHLNGPKVAPDNAMDILARTLLTGPGGAPEAIRRLEEIGLMDEVRKLVAGDPSRKARMVTWSDDAPLSDVLAAMDAGILEYSRIHGRAGRENIDRFLEIVEEVGPEAADKLLATIKNPGRGGVDMTAMRKGLKKEEIGKRMAQVREAVRSVLLSNPQLAEDPEAFRGAVSQAVGKRAARLALFKEAGMVKEAMKITDVSSGGAADVVAYQGDIWLVDDLDKHSSLPAPLRALLPKDPYTAPEHWQASEVLEQRPDIFRAHWDPSRRALWADHPGVGHFPGSSLLVKRVAEALGARDLTRSTSTGITEQETTFVRPEMEGQLPDIMYHGTSSLYAPSILQRGLTPGQSPTNYPRVVDHPDTVFLSADIAEAAMHADHTKSRLEDRTDWERKPRQYGGYEVVFGVEIPDRAKLVPDYDVDVSSSQSRWERPGGLWGEPMPSPSPNQSTRLSRDFGMVGYEGRIPASFIREVWVKDGERFLDFTEMTPSEFQFFLEHEMTEEEYVEYEQERLEEEEEFGSVARVRLVPLSKRAQGDYRRAWTILRLVEK